MAMYKFDPYVLLLCGVIFIVLLFLVTSCSMNCSGNISENYNRFEDLPYVSMCEFQPGCLWDTARWIQLSNGMEGVCTLHGIACPAFSKDHDRVRNMGLSPDMVSDRYLNELALRNDRTKIKERFNLYSNDWRAGETTDYDSVDESGSTAMDLGGYPTNTN